MQPAGALRPVWAEINLSAVESNLRALRAAAGTKIMFVVKADGYGHGAAALAAFAQEKGLCDWFGVSCIEEGLELRRAGVSLPVLVLGSIYPFSGFDAALEAGLSVTVAGYDAAVHLERAAARLGKTARCHIKIDTGMGRIGSRRPGAVKTAQFLAQSRSAVIEGVYTHLSSPDCDAAFTRLQLKHFDDALDDMARLGINPGLRHAAGSYAALNIPESRYDLIRPGLAAYGLMGDFIPALSLKSRIVFIKDMRAGASVSYNRSFRCQRPTRVATIPIGYGDGWNRRLSNCGCALVGGVRCRVLGNITMDMTMLDVTPIPDAKVGDEAALIGAQGGEAVTAQEAASVAATIPYEITSALTRRVPRVYTAGQPPVF
ncbi:MAG: alanine racemase [Elusimicrobiales bacterium]